MAENRLNRELDTREKTARKKSWTRPETLPTPLPEDGYEFHWVRISEIFVAGVENERFKDNIVIGGLMLCKTPVEFVQDRNAWFNNQAASQMKSVDNNLMRESDPRMPLYNERKTTVSRFGNGT